MHPSHSGKAFSKNDSTVSFLTVGQLAKRQSPIDNHQFFYGVLAQLVERLNGIEEVRGSNPLGSSLPGSELENEDCDPDNQRTSST